MFERVISAVVVDSCAVCVCDDDDDDDVDDEINEDNCADVGGDGSTV